MTTDTSGQAVEALRQSGLAYKTFLGPEGEMSPLHLVNGLRAELATLKAERMECDQFLKPEQSPAERMKQDHQEILGLMKMLANEKERNEKLKLVVQDVVRTNAINTEERDRYRHERDALKAERDALREAVEELTSFIAARMTDDDDVLVFDGDDMTALDLKCAAVVSALALGDPS